MVCRAFNWCHWVDSREEAEAQIEMMKGAEERMKETLYDLTGDYRHCMGNCLTVMN
jgi:hypothetical protein